MKYIIILFIACISSYFSSAQSCDSTRLILHSFKSHPNVTWISLEIDSIVDNQIVSTTIKTWDAASQSFIGGQTSTIQWDTIGNQLFKTIDSVSSPKIRPIKSREI
ncbi:MAG: hypothetical protein EYC69_04135 [Bacteroidetes bacterium]|nr:MAG: hypothetical protein EYC69_04135 [Bacteroidota bacterium]